LQPFPGASPKSSANTPWFNTVFVCLRPVNPAAHVGVISSYGISGSSEYVNWHGSLLLLTCLPGLQPLYTVTIEGFAGNEIGATSSEKRMQVLPGRMTVTMVIL